MKFLKRVTFAVLALTVMALLAPHNSSAGASSEGTGVGASVALECGPCKDHESGGEAVHHFQSTGVISRCEDGSLGCHYWQDAYGTCASIHRECLESLEVELAMQDLARGPLSSAQAIISTNPRALTLDPKTLQPAIRGCDGTLHNLSPFVVVARGI